MTNFESIMTAVSSIEGATMVRKGNENFFAIPMEDGTYAKISVGHLLSRDTKANKAFDFTSARAQYECWKTEADAKANKPKKVKGPNVEAQKKREIMDAMLEAYVGTMNGEFTATDVLNGCKELPTNTTVMAVGSSLIRLADKGVISFRMDGKKKVYTLGV